MIPGGRGERVLKCSGLEKYYSSQTMLNEMLQSKHMEVLVAKTVLFIYLNMIRVSVLLKQQVKIKKFEQGF